MGIFTLAGKILDNVVKETYKEVKRLVKVKRHRRSGRLVKAHSRAIKRAKIKPKTVQRGKRHEVVKRRPNGNGIARRKQ